MDVYWIHTTLQIWMNEIYYRHFQHYPRLYLFGVSQGSRMCALLCRVLPVQAQILYIFPGYRPSSLELRCRRLEQFYRLNFDSLSIKSINAKQQACRDHPTICPCYEEKKSLALEEYI